KGGTHYGARLDSLIERGFVDDAAAGTVDYTHAALHQGTFVTANEVCSSTGLGRMDGDEIHPGEQFRELQELYPHALAALPGHKGIVGQNDHSQALGLLGHQGANTAQTDDPQYFPHNLHADEAGALP